MALRCRRVGVVDNVILDRVDQLCQSAHGRFALKATGLLRHRELTSKVGSGPFRTAHVMSATGH